MIDDKLIDVSTYDMPTWRPDCFYRNGVRRAIVGVYPYTEARVRITTLREAGIEVAGLYGFVYFGDSDYYAERDTEWAIDLCQEFDIPMVWVDCESDAVAIGVNVPPSHPGQRIDQLRAALNKIEAAGLKAGIYTAAWWWPFNMAMSTAFKGYPLWHASYGDKGGEAPPVTTVSYGGWTDVAIHQYTSTKVLCGRGRDFNYLLAEQEGDMTPEVKARLEYLEGLVAGNGITPGPDGKPTLFKQQALDAVADNSLYLAIQLLRDDVWRLQGMAKDLQELRASFVTHVESLATGDVPKHEHRVTLD